MIRIVKAITLPLTLLLLILAFTVGIAHSQTVNGKYDGDGDRLIEVSNLEQLNAVRYDVNGDGRPDRDSDALVYSLAFPVGGTEAVCDEGCHGYELAGPLDFGEAGSYASGAVRAGWTSGSGWEPIGVDTSGRRFSATFDGNGHTVSNLYIDRAIGSDQSSGVGLFGVAGGSSVIRGIGLVNAEVHGYSRVGGLVGKHSGTISDSYATGNVTGSDDDVGGLVGGNTGQVSDSYAAGTVSGGADVGGLVGENTGQVSDSYATGGVTGSGNNVGGLVGRSAGPISDSYATGSVTGRNYVGGLVGEVGSDKTVIASYATGSVTASSGSYVGGLVGYAGSGATFTASYATGNVSGDSAIGGLVGYGSGITVIAGYATGSVTASSNYVGGLVGFGPGATVIASYATGRVSGVSGVGGLFGYGSGTTFIASYWDTGTSGQRSGVGSENVAGAEGKTTAELQSPTGDTGIYVAWNTDLDNADVDGNPATGAEDFWDFGTSSQYPALKADIDGNGVATWQEFGGQGRVPPPTPPLLPTPPPTVNGKYDGDGDRLIEVSNLEQLNAVRYDVNGDGRPDRDSDASVYSLAFPVGGTEAVCDKRCHGYELAGPLDFGEAGSYASGAVRAGWTSGSGWEPIGVDTSGRRFSATFDGNGHTVSNLYIDRAIGSDQSSGVGLFGVAGGSSVIRGIGLVNAEVHGYSRVGGLVGKHSGTISDSYATGNVTGSYDDVGGLVGGNTGQVSDSYAAGTVSGGADVGGLVGENTGQVSDSYATGGVTGSGNNVGGLVGRSAGPISDSYATGSVTGRNYVGGLVGEVGSDKTVIASYATGSVTASSGSYVGGLVGYAGSGATFTASYATGNVSGDSAIGGLVGYGSGITVIAGYATGSVTASSNYVGGLVGFGPGATVIASYATGRVSGVSGVGGLFGYGSGTTFIASYWDTGTSGQRSGVGSENVAGAEGKTTAELQSPTGDTGIYVAWNTDLDNADVDGNPATGAEDFWDFGTSSQYPALKADIDGNGVATWQEFGGQGRVPPPTPPLLPTPPPTVNGKYDGDGDRLIEVSNLEQLNAVRYDVNGDGRPDRDSDASVYSLAFPVGGTEAVCDKRCHGYELAGPLDFGEAGSYASGAVRAGWTSGSGWEPIGVDTSGRRFSATFDGNGHTVSNLYIDRAIGSDQSSGVGLFGVAGGSSVIRGIGLVNAEVHGYSRVGGLVGKHSGTISDSYATGNVTGSYDDVGGLVGGNTGQVSDSYAAGTVSGGADVGGLVGENTGQVSDSYATGGVTGSGNNVGGLVGRSAGPISDSYATGSVTGRNYVGGLVGEVGSDKTVIASYATGSVTASSGSYVGGLVGYAGSGATFTASYATGNVSGDSAIGGLVGYGSGITVIAGYATGSVTASSNYVGGLVGFGPGATVIASYATGRVSGVSGVGGLFGYGSGTTFIASYWDTGTSGQRSGVGSENVAGAEGKTTAELQSPTGDTGIYVAWNTDLDNADVDGNPATGAEDFWDFGTSSQYPALKADIDGNGVATWQEFGGQGRVPPPTPPLLPTPPPTVNGKYDGDGDRLIEVSNLEQLNAVRYDVNGDGRPDRDSDASVYSLAFPVGGTEAVCDKRCHGYELAGPLDFGEAGSYASGAVRAGWTSGSGWEPIGVDTSGRRFSATFDGNGHTVSNLYIDRAIGSDQSSGVGLFGVAGGSSVIRGIGLVNAEVHGYSRVGGLVGKHSGTISDSYATGNVTGSYDDVGGLVGGNTGQVSDSYAAGTVSGGADVGGLVGENTGQVSDSYATGGVTGSGNNVGGLVGRSAGPISDSYATGSVTGRNYVGGLVGEVGSDKTVIASYATGSVTASSGSYVGGLVGYAGSGATFTASYATGNVSGDSAIGGLVGYGSGITVIAGYATGSVTASSNYVGGLVGFGPGATVIASYATGRVSGVSGVGGLFGYGSGTTFIASYWDTGTSDQRSGVGSENVAGAEGKTTAELQSPTGDTGIYVAWNTDLDNADVDGNPATGAEDYLGLWDQQPVSGPESRHRRQRCSNLAGVR